MGQLLTTRVVEPGGSLLLLQRFSNNPYPEQNQPNSSYLHLFFKDLFQYFTPTYAYAFLEVTSLSVMKTIKLVKCLNGLWVGVTKKKLNRVQGQEWDQASLPELVTCSKTELTTVSARKARDSPLSKQ
jgi:hypothetical protein